jgi:flagellar biosynthesis protein FlhF
MNVTRFLARDAADAVGQIRSRLGADAVVVSVTRAPASGVSRFWRKPQLEVLACLPQRATAAPSHVTPVADAAPALNGQVPFASGFQLNQLDSDESDFVRPDTTSQRAESDVFGAEGSWRSGAVLHQMGLQPLHVEKVIERAQSQHGSTPPASLAQELALVCAALASFWRPAAIANEGSPAIHVFVGPPGSGKTTALSKWLAKSVLADGVTARAWRLDGRTANFASLLDVYGEILGVPVGREWNAQQRLEGFDVGFVDLPGVNARDLAAIRQLCSRVETIPGAQVHLVLNAAYDVSVGLAQARAFAALPVKDVIFTHIDEEKRLMKLWNFVLGTNFTVRFLSGGQNIPGEFLVAVPELLIPRQTGG